MAKNIDRFLRTSAAHLGLYTPQEDGQGQAGDACVFALGVQTPAMVKGWRAAAGQMQRARATNDDCVCC